MACICDICKNGELSDNHVSPSNRHVKRSWTPYIQKVKAVVDGEVKSVNVCTRCLRSGKVTRAI